MSEQAEKSYDYNDVTAFHQRAKQFERQSNWKIKNTEWNIQRIKNLHAMPLEELAERLKKLLAAQVSSDKLQTQFKLDYDSNLNQFNTNVDKLKTGFEEYKRLNQHPNEIAYLRAHDVNQLPEPKAIDNADLDFSTRGFFRSLFICVISIIVGVWILNHVNILDTIFGMMFGLSILVIFMLIPILAVVAFTFLYIFAKLNLPFSHPVDMYQNHKARATTKQILDADRRYCEENNRNNSDLLKQEFKYYKSYSASAGALIAKTSGEIEETQQSLATYAEEVSKQINFFPPDDTKDMRHLFRIYMLIYNGRAVSWKEATVLVDQSEEQERLHGSLIAEIRAAKGEIVATLNQAKEEIIGAVDRNTEQVARVQEEISRQTGVMEIWNRRQMEMAVYQADLTRRQNTMISDIAYKSYNRRR